MSDDAAGFREQAVECRQQAEKAINPLDKETWRFDLAALLGAR
jgi:hypothetical protein